LSLRKTIKRVAGKVQEKAKDVGRQVQSVAAKVVVPATAVLSTVGTFIGGPALGAAFALPGTALARGVGATAARKQGIKGMEARTEGRELARRTLKYGMLGMTAGMAGAGVVGLAGGVMGGGGLLGGLTGGVGNIFGIGGGGGALGQGSSFYDPALAGESPVGGETYLGGAQIPGSLPLGGAAAGASGISGGIPWEGILGAGTKLGQAYLTPGQQQQQPKASEGGGFGDMISNLFSTDPGSGAVDLPVVGQVPMGVLLIGGGLALWAVAK
jgi:hypothetical protein